MNPLSAALIVLLAITAICIGAGMLHQHLTRKKRPR